MSSLTKRTATTGITQYFPPSPNKKSKEDIDTNPLSIATKAVSFTQKYVQNDIENITTGNYSKLNKDQILEIVTACRKLDPHNNLPFLTTSKKAALVAYLENNPLDFVVREIVPKIVVTKTSLMKKKVLAPTPFKTLLKDYSLMKVDQVPELVAVFDDTGAPDFVFVGKGKYLESDSKEAIVAFLKGDEEGDDFDEDESTIVPLQMLCPYDCYDPKSYSAKDIIESKKKTKTSLSNFEKEHPDVVLAVSQSLAEPESLQQQLMIEKELEETKLELTKAKEEIRLLKLVLKAKASRTELDQKLDVKFNNFFEQAMKCFNAKKQKNNSLETELVWRDLSKSISEKEVKSLLTHQGIVATTNLINLLRVHFSVFDGTYIMPGDKNKYTIEHKKLNEGEIADLIVAIQNNCKGIAMESTEKLRDYIKLSLKSIRGESVGKTKKEE